MRIAEFLGTVDAFANLDRRSAEQLAGRLTPCEFRAGRTIIRRGDPGDCMYIIVEGQVRVPIFDDNHRPVHIAQLEARQFFGEMALLTGQPRRADVVAATNCTCLRVPREALDDLLPKNRLLARFLTAILGERLLSVNGIRQVGPYRLLRELGRGGTALVYEGFHPHLERPVAIKMLSHTLVYDEEFSARFRNEARIIARLRHPNIVEVYDTQEEYATLFIVMELLTGQDVADILDVEGSLDPDQVRDIVIHVADALGYAHRQGVVHRDVKPSNIVINQDGTVKLTDFGIALVPDMEARINHVDDGTALGTPHYMSPEQARDDTLDLRSDIYSLGVVAFEMLTGRAPFDFDDDYRVLEAHVYEAMPSPKDYLSTVPADLESFIARATEKDPTKRFQDCNAILEHFGVGRGAASMDSLQVETLTFIYPRRSKDHVLALIQRIRQECSQIEGLLLS